MTRLSTSFVRDRELIIVEAEVVGRAGRTTGARLVLDTGAAATTLTPNVIQAVGYSRRDAYKESTVHTAIGKERGYWIHVAEFTVLDVTTPDFAVTVFPLGHRDIDGLVGMNFLRHFNFEVRPVVSASCSPRADQLTHRDERPSTSSRTLIPIESSSTFVE